MSASSATSARRRSSTIFEVWGRFVYRRRSAVLAGSALLLALSVFALGSGGALTAGNPSLAEVELIKAIGIGLAIAVAIDATLVRVLIVPAVMRLLGDYNWWAPHPLSALHRWAGLDEPGIAAAGRAA